MLGVLEQIDQKLVNAVMTTPLNLRAAEYQQLSTKGLFTALSVMEKTKIKLIFLLRKWSLDLV